MFFLRGTISALIVLAALPLAAGEPVLTPQQGVLLLRNGNVIAGQITRAGDYYIVTLGASGEVRLTASDVETVCVDLEDAYQYKSATMTGKGASPHLDLAEWCLRHDLKDQAAEQLSAARQKEPANPRIIAVERKVKLALETPKPEPTRLPDTAATVSAEQLEKTIRALPPGTLEKFAGVAQPILLNRCATGGCHGPTAKSDFRLLRPPAGQNPSKRFTQRNLYAVLAYLDKENPEESPLLKLPQGKHGATLGPVFDKRTQHQLDDLIAWTRHVLEVPAPAPPATIAQTQALLSQQNGGEVKPAAAQAEGKRTPPAGRDETDAAAPRRLKPPHDALPLPRDGAPVPRDPFDPEIFNRQFGGKKK